MKVEDAAHDRFAKCQRSRTTNSPFSESRVIRPRCRSRGGCPCRPRSRSPAWARLSISAKFAGDVCPEFPDLVSYLERKNGVQGNRCAEMRSLLAPENGGNQTSCAQIRRIVPAASERSATHAIPHCTAREARETPMLPSRSALIKYASAFAASGFGDSSAIPRPCDCHSVDRNLIPDVMICTG